MHEHEGLCLFDYNGIGWIVGDGSKNGNGVCGDINQDLVIPSSYNNLPILCIAFRAFYNVRLTSISLPDTITFLNISCFDRCGATGIVTLPSSLEVLEYYAFSSNSITKFRIGSKLSYFGYGAFGDNPSLESIEIYDENQNFCLINNCLYDINVTILYCVPPLVTSFEVPTTVETLFRRSISLTNISSVTLPSSVKNINEEAFFRTSQLKSLHILGNLNGTYSNSIYNHAPNLTIYYHGHKPVFSSQMIYNKGNTKVYVCDQYPSQYFSDIKVNRYGSCFQFYQTIVMRYNYFLSILAINTFFLT